MRINMKSTNVIKECILAGAIQIIACFIIYIFNIPNPNIVLFVILSAVLVSWGYAPGIISGIIAFLYSAFFFSTNHSWFVYEPINRNKLIVIGLGVVANIIIIGQLQKRMEKTNEENARLEKRVLEEIAYTDAMTGLENRCAYEQEKKRLEERADAFVIIMVCDMNGLKQLNDTMGHRYGDMAICKMAEFLKQSFESQAKCYRIGGDEFCVFSECTNMESFENSRKSFIELVTATENTDCKFGVATGVASGVSADIDKIFREADYLMYACKKRMKEDAARL